MAVATQTFPIVPDTRVLETLGATGEPAYKAIAELIDNAIDAASGSRVTVEVAHQVTRGRVSRITVEDDGAGMAAKSLAEAMTIGRSSKKGRQLGRFGMGLKTALASLGKTWTLTTGTRKCETAHQLTLNLPAWLKAQNWEVQVASVPKVLPFESESGTRIEVTDCDHINAATFERDLSRHLGTLFKHFLASGRLSLFVNGEPVSTLDAELLDGTRKRITLDINGKAVTGWAGVRAYGSGSYGIELIRNGRVVESDVKLGFAAHHEHNRVIGELHLDTFEVNHHKTAFVRTGDDWPALEAALAKELASVAKASEKIANATKKHVSKDLEKLVTGTLGQMAEILRRDPAVHELFGPKRAAPRTPKEKVLLWPVVETVVLNPVNLVIVPRAKRVVTPKLTVGKLAFTHAFAADGSAAPRYRFEVVEGALAVTTNADHPAFPEPARQHGWVVRNAIEALAAYRAQQAAAIEQSDSPELPRYEEAVDALYRSLAASGFMF